MIRVLGAVTLVAGCGGFGLSLGTSQRRETKQLRQVKKAVQEMEWELKYRLTELPDLCRIAASTAGGEVGRAFSELANKLERREVEDLSGTFHGILSNRDLTSGCGRALRMLGNSLGRYDLEAQLQGLEAVRQQCDKDLLTLEGEAGQRLRCYQTLILCAGTILAILLL